MTDQQGGIDETRWLEDRVQRAVGVGVTVTEGVLRARLDEHDRGTTRVNPGIYGGYTSGKYMGVVTKGELEEDLEWVRHVEI